MPFKAKQNSLTSGARLEFSPPAELPKWWKLQTQLSLPVVPYGR